MKDETGVALPLYTSDLARVHEDFEYFERSYPKSSNPNSYLLEVDKDASAFYTTGITKFLGGNSKFHTIVLEHPISIPPQFTRPYPFATLPENSDLLKLDVSAVEDLAKVVSQKMIDQRINLPAHSFDQQLILEISEKNRLSNTHLEDAIKTDRSKIKIDEARKLFFDGWLAGKNLGAHHHFKDKSHEDIWGELGIIAEELFRASSKKSQARFFSLYPNLSFRKGRPPKISKTDSD